MNKLKAITATLAIGTIMMLNGTAIAGGKGRNAEGAPVVYVTSQGLYYDSIVLNDLPQKGNFQQLIPGVNGLETEFGPGEVGHLGGRWWIDANGDQVMNDGDLFFLCPLLGPGRETL